MSRRRWRLGVVGSLALALGALGGRAVGEGEGEAPSPPPGLGAPDPEAPDLDGLKAQGVRPLAARLADAEALGARTRAIEAALEWLALHQHPDGPWPPNELTWVQGVQRDPPAAAPGAAAAADLGRPQYVVGVTSLVLLAFQAAGHDHVSGGPHAATCERALAWLVAQQDPDGCVGPRTSQHYVYGHGYATKALVQAYALTGDRRLRRPAQRALDFSQAARNPKSAWRYGIQPGDNDTSVTGVMMDGLLTAWHLNRAALEHGLPAPFRLVETPGSARIPLALVGGALWLDAMTDRPDGRLGYTQAGTGSARTPEMVDTFPAELSESMTALALWVRLSLPPSLRASPWAQESIALGTKLLLGLLPRWTSGEGTVDLYYWHYGTLAMSRLGGDAWLAWDAALVRALVEHQRLDTTPAEVRGSWDPADPWGPDGGRFYSTAMAVLCLCAPGRHVEGTALARDTEAVLRAPTATPAARRTALRTVVVHALADLEAAVLPHLGGPTPEVRRAAAEALVATGPSPKGVAALGALLDDPDPSVRAGVAASASRLPPPRALPLAPRLEARLRDPDPEVRRGAFLALAGLVPPSPATMGAIRSALTDADPRVRAVAAGWGSAEPTLAAETTPVFLALLADPAATSRRAALLALLPRQEPPAALSQAIAAMTADADPEVAVRAAGLLARWGDPTPASLNALVTALASPEASLRRVALEALSEARLLPGSFGALEAPLEAALARMVAAEAAAIRVLALRAAAAHLGARALPLLYGAATDDDLVVSQAAREALGALKAPTAERAAVLLQALGGEDEWLAGAAHRGLLALGRAAVDPLRGLLAGEPGPRRRAALRVLVDLGALASASASTIAGLLAAETSPAEVPGLAAALAAVGTKDAKAVATLARWATQADAPASEASTEALGRLAPGFPAAEEALRAIAANTALQDRMRGQAARSLGHLERPKGSTTDFLVRAYLTGTNMLSLGAGDALARIGAPAVSTLVERLNAEKGSAQVRVLELLARIGPRAKAARAAVERLTKASDMGLSDQAQRTLRAIAR